MVFRKNSMFFSANYPFRPTYTKNKRMCGVNQKVVPGLSVISKLEENVIGTLGDYVIWNIFPDNNTIETQIAKAVNTGYKKINKDALYNMQNILSGIQDNLFIDSFLSICNSYTRISKRQILLLFIGEDTIYSYNNVAGWTWLPMGFDVSVTVGYKIFLVFKNPRYYLLQINNHEEVANKIRDTNQDVLFNKNGIYGFNKDGYIIVTKEEKKQLTGYLTYNSIIFNELGTYYSNPQLNEIGVGVDIDGYFPNGKVGGFYDYDEILAKLDDLFTKYGPNGLKQSNLIHNTINDSYPVNVIGKTQVGEKNIHICCLGLNPETNQNSDRIVLVGALHPREYASPTSLINYMYWLCENFSDIPITTDEINATSILTSKTIWIIPLLNVDGYIYNNRLKPYGPDTYYMSNENITRYSGGGWQRKNLRNSSINENIQGIPKDNGNPKSNESYWYNGVDLNRNFSIKFNAGDGYSTDINNQTYHGTDSFSESETKALRDFLGYIEGNGGNSANGNGGIFSNKNNIKMFIDIHAYTDIVSWSGGYSPINRELASEMSSKSNYVANIWTAYETNGTSDQWIWNNGDSTISDNGNVEHVIGMLIEIGAPTTYETTKWWNPRRNSYRYSGFWPTREKQYGILKNTIPMFASACALIGSYPKIMNVYCNKTIEEIVKNKESASFTFTIKNIGLNTINKGDVIMLKIMNNTITYSTQSWTLDTAFEPHTEITVSLEILISNIPNSIDSNTFKFNFQTYLTSNKYIIDSDATYPVSGLNMLVKLTGNGWGGGRTLTIYENYGKNHQVNKFQAQHIQTDTSSPETINDQYYPLYLNYGTYNVIIDINTNYFLGSFEITEKDTNNKILSATSVELSNSWSSEGVYNKIISIEPNHP